jgi:hypothetical protein
MRTKRLLLFSVFLLSLSASLDAQSANGIIASSRSIDWTQAGVIGGIPSRTTICQTLGTAGQSPSSVQSVTAAQINTAIANCASGQVVFLNIGTYNLSGGIVFNNKSNVTLRGAGADQTKLVFSAGTGCAGWGGSDVCLMAADIGDGGDGNFSNTATWSAGYAVGTQAITRRPCEGQLGLGTAKAATRPAQFTRNNTGYRGFQCALAGGNSSRITQKFAQLLGSGQSAA